MRWWSSSQPHLKETSASIFTCRSVPSSSSSRHLHNPCPQGTTLLRVAPALWSYISITPVNQGLNKLGHHSFSLSDICVHIFDSFQLRLRPDHTASPTICSKHRDHHQDHLDLLDTLSSRNYWPPKLSTQQRLHPCISTVTAILHPCISFMYDFLIKTWHSNLSTCPCYLSSSQSITFHLYKCLRDR